MKKNLKSFLYPLNYSKLITKRKGRIKPSLQLFPKHFQTAITKIPIDFPSNVSLENQNRGIFPEIRRSTISVGFNLPTAIQGGRGMIEQIFTKLQIMQTIGYRLFPQRNEITRRGNYENSNYVSVIDDRVRPAELRCMNRGG